MTTVDKIMSIYESMDLSELATEAVTAAQDSQRQLKSSLQNAITAGRYLTAAKSKVEHGEWNSWLTNNWEAKGFSPRTARRYMQLATSATGLSEVESQRAALEAVTEIKLAARGHFETEPLKPLKPDTIERPDPIAAADPPEVDDDPTPQPQSTTKHTAESRKVPEAEKQPTQPVPVVDVSVDPIDNLRNALADIQKSVQDGPQCKKIAKELRKTADKLDPQKYPIPTIEDVEAFVSERGWNGFDSEKFWNHYELADWKYGKAKTPLKKWKIAAGQAWNNGAGWCASGSDQGVAPW